MVRSKSKMIFSILCLAFIALHIILPEAAYEVRVDGRPMGAVSSRESLERLITAHVKEVSQSWPLGGALASGIEYERIYTDHGITMYAHEAVETIAPYLSIWPNAAMIYSDGQKTYAAPSEAEAREVLNSILADAGGNAGFAEEITIHIEPVPPEKIKSGRALLSSLFVKDDSSSYIVQEYDTAQSIADSIGLTTAQLYNLNPILNSAKVAKGMELLIGEPANNLHVVKEIPATRYVSLDPLMTLEVDSTLYTTQQVTVQRGQSGTAVAELLITTVDGVETETKIISQKTISAPISGIARIGTQTPEYGSAWNEQAAQSWIPVNESSEWEMEAKRVQAALATRIGTQWLLWPVAGGGRISSFFGLRDGREHQGIDIASDLDTPVYAAHSGAVAYSGERGSYGKLVVIDHGFGVTTRYAHLNSLMVVTGDEIRRGDPIGLVGSTGRSTGPHLHFELCNDETPSDPLFVLSPPQQE